MKLVYCTWAAVFAILFAVMPDYVEKMGITTERIVCLWKERQAARRDDETLSVYIRMHRYTSVADGRTIHRYERSGCAK